MGKRKLTKAEAGRLGGRATVNKHGVEHMSAIGKAGFAALRRKFGFMGGSGRGALRWLNRQGRIAASPDPDPESRIFHELWEQLAPRRKTRSSPRSWRRSGRHPSPQMEGCEMPQDSTQPRGTHRAPQGGGAQGRP